MPDIRKQLADAFENGDVHEVAWSREDARNTVVDDDDLENAIDEAQGSADAKGKVAFVLIKIEGGDI